MANYGTRGEHKGKHKRPETPEGYDDAAAFLCEMRERFEDGESFDSENRQEGEEDIRFVCGEQWHSSDLQARAGRPSLTVNRLPAFIGQLFGAKLANETQIKIIPEHDGTKQIAEIREKLVRQIQKQSDADYAFDEAAKYQYVCGVGNFCLNVDYTENDVFYQDIVIKAVDRPFAVVWDWKAIHPTGKDARWVFVVDDMARDEFKTRYPWASLTDFSDNSPSNREAGAGWYAEEVVRVVSYWRMMDEDRTLAMTVDGRTVDVTDVPEEEWMPMVARRPDGTPLVRDTVRTYAEMYLCSGADILEGPYRLPIDRVPVFRVAGWEFNVGETRKRWGVIRFLKDPQRLHNYWRALAVDTPLPTPSGWTTMGAVQAGEQLLDETGKPCTVLGKSPVHTDKRCYRVTFDDGTDIVAAHDHLWRVEEWGANGWQELGGAVTTEELKPGKHSIWADGVDRPEHTREARRFRIKSVKEVPPVRVQCVGVDAPSHLFLAGASMIPTHNSTIAEKLLASPRATFVAGRSATAGFERDWEQAHITNRRVLYWNDDAASTPPQHIAPPPIDQTLIGEAGTTVQDMRDVSNIHEANLGAQGNEVSGKGILARQQIGELGAMIYSDRQRLAMEECGRVINQLIPTVYDTERVIAINDGENVEVLRINQQQGLDILNDITVGKYRVAATIGRSYATRRMETADAMMNLVNAMPQEMAVVKDLVVQAQDWPMADRIAARLRKTLPPGVLEPSEMSDDERAQMQQQAQQQAQIQQLMAQLAVQEKQAGIAETQGRATESNARAKASEIKAMVELLTKMQDRDAESANKQADTLLKQTRAAEAAARARSTNIDAALTSLGVKK